MIQIRRSTFAAIIAALAIGYTALGIVLIPYVDAMIFKPFRKVRLVAPDDDKPDQLVEYQLDRICWAYHLKKARDVVTIRRSITLIDSEGFRHFNLPIDPRTGEMYNNRNAREKGWEGKVTYCTFRPDGVDLTAGFSIENYGQFASAGLPYILDQSLPTLRVPPMMVGEAR